MPQQQTSSTTWALISGACLVLGLAVGYVIFGGQQRGGAGGGAGRPGPRRRRPPAGRSQA